MERLRPTDLRQAVEAFLEDHPRAMCTKKFSVAVYSRYVSQQVLVMLAHCRRMQHNETKRAEAFN
eukprot:3541857-Lingulodinium_polyedra.AAC.1